MNKSIFTAAVTAALACASAHAETHLVVAKANSISDDLIADIQAAGGTVTGRIDAIGVLQVEANTGFVVAGADVVPELQVSIPDAEIEASVTFDEAAAAAPPFTGDDDFYFDLQWGHTAVGATEAWANGHRGAGVRVAVLDSGIASYHPDLSPNLNTQLSASFVPGEAYDNPPGSHGTHVAGTIAAADNAFGTIGVAPDAEIVAVKVLSAITGSGSSFGVMQGIVYAADIDSDVINMSLGSTIPHNYPGATAWINSVYLKAYNRATRYANSKGVTIIAAAGNSAIDGDHDGNLVWLPNSLNHVISISATAPYGWLVDPLSADLDTFAAYSNYGQSAIDFAAPGGDWKLAFDPSGIGFSNCGWMSVPCYAYDYVFSTGPGGWYWSVGTSMASPHAAGVAALIIGANGGDMSPAHVEREMRRLADDLGKPGNDDFYGAGRVSVRGL